MDNLNSYKPLTSDAVRSTAQQLLQSNGVITTLEVKNQLRQAGYLAFQNEVSNMMQQIAQEQGWTHSFNGTFREYRLPVSVIRHTHRATRITTFTPQDGDSSSDDAQADVPLLPVLPD